MNKKPIIPSEVIIPVRRVKGKRNTPVHIDKRQLHIHLHKHNQMNMPKPKTNSRICLMCNTYKRLENGENFCSPNCFDKYNKYKRERLHNRMDEHYNSTDKSWWKFWK